MNITKQQIFILVSILVFLFLSIIVFTLPSFNDIFNISSSSTSNIGSTIGGITAPLIGLFSSYLLFITLNKQTDTINQQEVKNEIDLIFSLINQLHIEITYFYHTENQKEKDCSTIQFKYSGIEAFHRFVQYLNTDNDLDRFNYTFYSYYQTKQLLLFLRSFCMLEDKIKSSFINESQKQTFLLRINNIYECLFKKTLEILVNKIEKHEKMKDIAFNEVVDFLKNH